MRRCVLLVAVVGGLIGAGPARAATTVVTPASLGTWQTFLTDANGAVVSDVADGGVSFVAGPAIPPAGQGSARLRTATGRGDGSAQLRSTLLDGTPLNALRTLTYATYAKGTNAAPQVPFLRLTLDVDGNGTPDDTIVFEPVYQHGYTVTVPDQGLVRIEAWQTWDARRGGWWSTTGVALAGPGRNVKTIDQILAFAPNARIVATPSGRGGLNLASGHAQPADRFEANVDAVTVDGGPGPTTFDFEEGPPPPTEGKSVVAALVSGDVFVRPAKSSPEFASASQAPGFVPLKGGMLLPVGSSVDARRGRVAITSAGRTKRGARRMHKADFFDGIFQIKQARKRGTVTDILLRSPGFDKVCGTRATGSRAIAAQRRRSGRRSRRVVSRLRGSGRGRYRTRGRHSAATVRGTIWLTEERCDGTLTRVTRGRITVRDNNTGRSVTLSAGQSYLARAVRATTKTRRR